MCPHSASWRAVPVQRCSCRNDAQASGFGQGRSAACLVTKWRHPLLFDRGPTGEEADEEQAEGLGRRRNRIRSRRTRRKRTGRMMSSNSTNNMGEEEGSDDEGDDDDDGPPFPGSYGPS